MKLTNGKRTCEATLTALHPISRLHVPFLILDDGEALGVLDAAIDGWGIVEATEEKRPALLNAGYSLLNHGETEPW